MAPAPSPAYQRLREFIAERMRMVGRVLTGNGITEVQQGCYRLIDGEELSDTERDELLPLCHRRLDAFRASGP